MTVVRQRHQYTIFLLKRDFSSIKVPHPPLVFQYQKYCECLDNFSKSNTIDLQRETFFPPSFTLPIALLIMKNATAPRINPANEEVASYLTTVLGTRVEDRRSRTYLPLVRLPAEEKDSCEVLEHIYEIQRNDSSAFGGELAFKYVVNELVDNIYQHSKFKIAFVMAQRYPVKKFVELAFMDDGITIQGSYKEHNKKFGPIQSIIKALNGLSTKSEERGWGLRSSIKLFREGLKGQILIVSGAGAVYLDGSKQQQYRLSKAHRMDGTLISLRVPYPSPIVDIYKYIAE